MNILEKHLFFFDFWKFQIFFFEKHIHYFIKKMFLKKLKFSQKNIFLSLDRPKKYFLEKLKKFRTYRSTQNLIADRLRALSGSENHSQSPQTKKYQKNVFFTISGKHWDLSNQLSASTFFSRTESLISYRGMHIFTARRGWSVQKCRMSRKVGSGTAIYFNSKW